MLFAYISFKYFKHTEKGGKQSSLPLLVEDTVQDPQWMPRTADKTLEVLCFSLYHISMIKFNA